MLRVEDATVRYGEAEAISGVTLDVADGGVTAVLGPSGCGKSTLLRAVAGLEPLAHGRIVWDDADLAGVPTHRRGFALMFQDGQLFDHLSVADNVGYPLRIRRTERARRRERVMQLLDTVGLTAYADRAPGSLSGGERQRVALARALAVAPRLLLLDEPLSALDRGLRERLATDLREILRDSGTTALLVTHDHEEAFAVADRMALMRSGRVVQEGTLADVWAQPADADAARFLGYARVLEPADAAALLAAAAPSSEGTHGRRLALRRSALVVDETGPVPAVVASVTGGPEQSRLVCTVTGLGEVDAVAPSGAALPAVGSEIRLRLDRSRTAVVGDTASSDSRSTDPTH